MSDIGDILENLRQKGVQFDIYYCALCNNEHYSHSELGLRHSIVRNEFGIFLQNPHLIGLEFEYAQNLI